MNCHKMSMFGTMLCLLGLGFSDTAAGQTLTASPVSPVQLSVLQNAVSSQSVSITSSNGSTTLCVALANTPTWLTVNGMSGNQPFCLNTASNGTLVLPYTVNTAGLATGQMYIGTFTVQVNQDPNPSAMLTYTVNLTVGNPSLLMASPGTASFSAVVGALSGNPSAGYPITITSSGQQLDYTVSTQPQANTGNWILVDNGSGTTNSNAPGFTIQVNPSLLTTPGNYTGTVTVSSKTTNDTASIPVTLTVTAGSELNITGSLKNFIFQSGSASVPPETQSTLMISTTSGTLNYQVLATAVSGPTPTTNWLLNPTGGLATTTPQALSLSLASAVVNLTPGRYVINLAICPTNGSGTVCPADTNTTNILVTLVVSTNAILAVSPAGPLTYTLPFNGTTSTTINVTSSGASVPYNVVVNQSWLSVSQIQSNGATPSSFIITVSANLSPSATPYVGTVTVSPTNSDNGVYNIPITVSLTVTNAGTQIYAAPDALLFSYETTVNTPGLQQVNLTSSTPVNFTVATTETGSSCPGSNWLNVQSSSASTPAVLAISITTAGMTSGICSGIVTVTYNGASANASLTIPVTVDISAPPTPLLTITPDPAFGVFTATYGSTTPITSRISVNSTDLSALNFSASASTPGAPYAWLSVGYNVPTTQQYVSVTISPTGPNGAILPVGVYNGSITIHAANSANLPSGDFALPVVLTISANTTVAVSPASHTLSFSEVQGGTLPVPQAITLTATGGSTTYTATIETGAGTGGNWLQVSPTSGTANSTASTITATILANSLTPGQYVKYVDLAFINSATPITTVTVTLNVSAAQTVTVSPLSLIFNYQLGAAAPAVQNLNLTSAGGAVTFSTSLSASWLVVTPPTGTTGSSGSPLVLAVSLATSAFTTAQTYNGTITITPTTGQAAIVIPVTAIVTGVPLPQPTSISNSASGQFGPIAPGELITIKGGALGPATPASFTVAANNTLSNLLAGVQVFFDNIPGTPIYVSSTQINVIVPYEIAGRSSTSISVLYQGQQSAAIPQNVAAQAPGIFTFSATGSGQAAALNQNFTFNGPQIGVVVNGSNIPTTPAARGSVIVVYMTGGGQTTPPSVTGTVTPASPFYIIPTNQVTATINGVNAPVQFAGAAPGEVNGVIQVNITVPASVAVGNALPLVVTINGVSSPFGATVAVQ